MKLKTDLKRIRKLSDMLGNLMDERNSKVCSDCPKAISYEFVEGTCEDKKIKLETVEHARRDGNLCSKEAGCCTNCKDSYWYIPVTDDGNEEMDYIESYDKQLKKLKKKYNWDSYYHFFDTKKKRCRLPRHKRSNVCLIFGLSCLFNLSDIKELKISEKIERICKIIKDLKIRHGLIC